MASTLRRKLRRYLLGATQKATRVWWIGQVTVRVMVCTRRGNTTRPVREKAHYGAEKSCLTRRRKRGLRLNRADRGNADRPVPATSSNTPSSRKVNHIGRKHIWAQKASNTLRKQCEKYNKYPRGHLTDRPKARALRLKMRQYLLAKWARLHDRAVSSGIPLVTCFHESFWKYLLVETSRGNAHAGWDFLLAGLPRAEKLEPRNSAFAPPAEQPSLKRRTRWGKSLPPKVNRTCRMCGHVGSGEHAWNACRPVRRGSDGVTTRQKKGVHEKLVASESHARPDLVTLRRR
jgi:hypothetical protein